MQLVKEIRSLVLRKTIKSNNNTTILSKSNSTYIASFIERINL